MRNLYHPVLKTTAEDYSPNDPESPLRRCDYFSGGFVCGDINKRKALGFVYPPEIIADEIMDGTYIGDRTKERIIKIIEKYI